MKRLIFILCLIAIALVGVSMVSAAHPSYEGGFPPEPKNPDCPTPDLPYIPYNPLGELNPPFEHYGPPIYSPVQ